LMNINRSLEREKKNMFQSRILNFFVSILLTLLIWNDFGVEVCGENLENSVPAEKIEAISLEKVQHQSQRSDYNRVENDYHRQRPQQHHQEATTVWNWDKTIDLINLTIDGKDYQRFRTELMIMNRSVSKIYYVWRDWF
ncbi:hypothetical protein SSS_09742, partial [Sarcoptes scabiei]